MNSKRIKSNPRVSKTRIPNAIAEYLMEDLMTCVDDNKLKTKDVKMEIRKEFIK